MPTIETLTLTVAGCEHTLEARRVLTGDAPFALIAPPHPLYGGSIGNPVVRALEQLFQQRGLSTLAFNFRGTGESTGTPSGDLDDALVDYAAALRAVGDAPAAWLSGYSFGSIAALAAAVEREAPRVLMIAPPLALLDPALVARYGGSIAIAVGTEDDYVPLDDLRAVFANHPRVALEIVPDAEHFFLGSAVRRLSDALEKLLSVAGTT